MAWRNTILEKNPTKNRIVAIKRGFHPPLQLTWDTNARVLRANFEIHANFVLRNHLVQQTKTRDNDRRSQQCPRQRWNGLKIWSYASAHAAFLPDLLFADAVHYTKTGLLVDGAGCFRVLAVVTAVCVVAVDDSVVGTVVVAGVDVEPACVK